MSHRPKNMADRPRFELPALKLDFGNITDGTNIPPPLPSPKAPTAPQTGLTLEVKGSGPVGVDNADGISTGTYHPEECALTNPTASARPGTMRRMLSKRALNNTTAESQIPGGKGAPVLDIIDRPQSRSGSSLMDDRKSKRSSGWFRRFRSGEQSPSRRSSFLFGGSSTNLSIARHTELPPPMIPELRELEKEGSLGYDIFRDVK